MKAYLIFISLFQPSGFLTLRFFGGFLAAFLLLGSYQLLPFLAGMLLMGVAHAIITVKGTHLASHGALSESQAWSKFWAIFFIEVRGKQLNGSKNTPAGVALIRTHTELMLSVVDHWRTIRNKVSGAGCLFA